MCRRRLGQPRLVLVGQANRLRIVAPHPMTVRIVDTRLGPFPALGQYLPGDLAQPLHGKRVEQARILEETAVILGEQVANDIAPGLGVGIGADEHGPPVARGHVARGEVAPDDPRLLVPRQVIENLLLTGMVVGDDERRQLVERQPVLPIDVHQLRADRAEPQPPLDDLGRHAEPRADFLRAPSLVAGKLVEALELIGRMKLLPIVVLIQAHLGRIVLGVEPAADKVVLPDLLALGAQQIGEPAPFASGDEIAAGRLAVLHLRLDDEVLIKPLGRDGRGERCNELVGMRHLADVLRGLLELVQGDEHGLTVLRALLGRHGFDGIGHFLTPWA